MSIGLWQDQGAQDAGSRWSFSQVDNVRTYTLSSAGMPASAKITINGKDYTGVNAQGDTKLSSATLDPSDVSVTCGEGYGYTIIVDNANNQINVDFVQLFTPTLSPTAEKLHPYYLKMSSHFVGYKEGNLRPATKRSEADRFLFIEKATAQGQYYIYDIAAQRYITYTAVANDALRTTQTGSKVQLAATEQAAKTWKIVLRADGESVTILPGEVTQINGGTPSWNFTGGTAYNAVLNLWRADDANSAWTIVDPSLGSLACATIVFRMPTVLGLSSIPHSAH